MMLQSYDEDENEVDNTEEKLSKLQNNIHHIERKIRMTDSEKTNYVERSTLEIKKYDLEIKQLMMQIKELEVRIKRNQKADENAIAKEFRKHNRGLGRMKGKSGREAIAILDADVLELDKKCKVYGHELQLLKRNLICYEEQLKEMTLKCNEDFDNKPTEFDSLQRVRELENEQQKMNKNILECELAQSKFKTMKEQLQMNQLSYPVLLLKAENEYLAQQKKAELLETGQVENTDTEASLDTKISSDLGGGDANPKEDFDNQRIRGIFLQKENISDSCKSEESDQQKELREMQEAFEKIKEVTGVSDIQDAEGRFIVQKSMNEDLHDLRKRLVKSLHELKMEKKQLDCKMALLRGVDAEGPKRELVEELTIAKHRQEEQEKRKKEAKLELDKMTTLLSEIETRQRQIVNLLESHFPEAVISKELTTPEVSKKIEEVLMNNLKQ